MNFIIIYSLLVVEIVMLSTKLSVSSKTKDVNVKLFNAITRINEGKTCFMSL